MTQAITHRLPGSLAWRRGAACLATALLPSLCWGNWAKVGENESLTLYVDRSSMQREDYVQRVWEIQDLKAPDADGVRSRQYINEYDCKHQMHRIGKMVSYAGPMLTGRKLFDLDNMGNWRKVSGAGLFAVGWVIHCGR